MESTKYESPKITVISMEPDENLMYASGRQGFGLFTSLKGVELGSENNESCPLPTL